MREEEVPTAAGRARRAAPVREALPLVKIRSSKDMAVMCARHHRLLRDYVQQAAPEADTDTVELIADRAVARLLAMRRPRLDHGLRYASGLVKQECERYLAELQQADEPVVDVFIGEITPEVERAIERLGRVWQRTLRQRLSGKTPTEIARAEGVDRALVNQRLHHARRRVVQLLHEAQRTAPALLLLGPRRLRDFVLRHGERLPDASAPSALTASAIVPLLTMTLLTAAPSATLVTALSARPPQTAAPDPAQPLPGAVMALAAAAPRPAGSGAWRAAMPPAPAVVPGGLRGAAAETPEDIILTALATPADGCAVIVAIGKGRRCTCPVLLQSLDGGTTWTATDGPPGDATQLALPPSYPSDPRIFAGVSALDVTGAPYVADRFGAAFRQLAALPAGAVAVSSRFDSGDARLFSSSTSGVWSVTLTDRSSSLAHQEIASPTTAISTDTVAVMATPRPSSSSPAVLAWAPAAGTGAGANPSTSGLASGLWRCGDGSACAVIGQLPAAPWGLTVAGADGQALIAYTRGAAYASQDGGHSFAKLPLPADAAVVRSIVLVGPALMPWLSGTRRDGAPAVWERAGDGSWSDAAADTALLHTHLAELAPVGPQRVLAVLRDVGYRCAAVAPRLAWLARCPAA